MISLFSNLTNLVLWKKYCVWEPWLTMFLLQLTIVLSVFITICIFVGYKQNRHQKVFNRGLYHCAVGLDILKFDKNSTDLPCGNGTGHKPSNKNFSPVKNLGFRWTKADVHRLITAKLNKKRKFDKAM